MRGYIKQENLVVQVQFRLMKRRTLQPEFIERKFDAPEPKARPELAAPEPQPTLAASLPAKPVQLTLTGPVTAQTTEAAPREGTAIREGEIAIWTKAGNDFRRGAARVGRKPAD